MDERSGLDNATVVTATVLLVVLAVVLAYVVWVIPELGACGGDGGSPYAKDGSTLASVCAARDAVWGLLLLVPPVMVAAGGALSLWRQTLRPLRYGCVAALLIMAVPFVAVWVVDGPGQRALLAPLRA